jgi:hypothetical protein
VDAASGTFGVRLNLPNPEYRIPAGLKCRARILPAPPGLKMTLSPNGQKDTVAFPQATGAEGQASPDGNESELQQLERLADLRISPTDGAPALTNPSSVMCRTLGPFESRKQTEALVSALAEAVVAVSTRNETESTITGYMVLIPPKEAGVAPKELTDKLKDSRVTDRVLLGGGPYSGQVSVGLYSGQRSAERRRDEVAALGYPAYVRPRINQKNHTWLDVELVDDGSSEMKLLEAVDRIHPQLDVEIAPCQKLAGTVNGTERSAIQ